MKDKLSKKLSDLLFPNASLILDTHGGCVGSFSKNVENYIFRIARNIGVEDPPRPFSQPDFPEKIIELWVNRVIDFFRRNGYGAEREETEKSADGAAAE